MNYYIYDIINPDLHGLISISYSSKYLCSNLLYKTPITKKGYWPFVEDYFIPGHILDTLTNKVVIDNIQEYIKSGEILEINSTPCIGKNSSYKVMYQNGSLYQLPFIELEFAPLEAKMKINNGKIMTYTIPNIRRYEFNSQDEELVKKDINKILKKVKKTIGDCLILDKHTNKITYDFYL